MKPLKYISLLIAVVIFFNIGLAEYSNPRINTVSVLKIGNNSVFLTGTISNTKHVNEYGFAVSHFPFPPVEGQKVEFYRMTTQPLNSDMYTKFIDGLNSGTHYFFAAYYKKANDYYFGDYHSFSTERAVRATVKDTTVTVSNKDIAIPIIFEKNIKHLAGEISLSFDNTVLDYVQIKNKGFNETYRKSLGENTNNKNTVINYSWCFENEIDLHNLSLTFIFRLKDDILKSGHTPIEIKNFQLIDSVGQSVATEIQSGSVNYQYKHDKVSVTDKFFNDNDLVYSINKSENAEEIVIEHNASFIYARWSQAKAYFKQNSLPITVLREYKSETNNNDNRPIIERSIFTITNKQKQELIDANIALSYLSEHGIDIFLTDKSLQQAKDNNQSLQIQITKLNQNELSKLRYTYASIKSAYRIDINLNSEIEVKMPIDKSINTDKLRINALYNNGKKITVVPYYMYENKQKLACFKLMPNATFILSESEKKSYISNIGEKTINTEQKQISLNSSFKIDNNKILVPLEVLQKCFGLKVSYNNNDLIFINDGRELVASLTSKVVLVDRQAVLLKEKQKIISGKIYLTEEFLKNIINADIQYRKENKQVIIKY